MTYVIKKMRKKREEEKKSKRYAEKRCTCVTYEVEKQEQLMLLSAQLNVLTRIRGISENFSIHFYLLHPFIYLRIWWHLPYIILNEIVFQLYTHRQKADLCIAAKGRISLAYMIRETAYRHF